MSTPAELLAARATAGTAYATAIATLRAAYIELKALDLICAMGKNGGNTQPQTFRGEFEVEGVPWQLRHPVYAPNHLGGVGDAVQARVAVVDRSGL